MRTRAPIIRVGRDGEHRANRDHQRLEHLGHLDHRHRLEGHLLADELHKYSPGGAVHRAESVACASVYSMVTESSLAIGVAALCPSDPSLPIRTLLREAALSGCNSPGGGCRCRQEDTHVQWYSGTPLTEVAPAKFR